MPRIRSLLALLILAAMTSPARGYDAGLPEQPFWVCAKFTSNPGTVVADVREVGNTQIGNNVTATQQTLDSTASSAWCVDLNAVSGFAPDCTPRTYVVRFVPNSTNCAAAQSPSQCAEEIVTSGGAECWAAGTVGTEQTVVYPTVAIPARGITATVIAKGNPSYIKHEIKISGSAVAATYYQVFYYDVLGRVDRTVRSATVPSP